MNLTLLGRILGSSYTHPYIPLVSILVTNTGALIRCHDILLERKIRVVGIDYDADYVHKANHAIQKANLDHVVSVVTMSVYDVVSQQQRLIQISEPRESNPTMSSQPATTTTTTRDSTAALFDVIYFSGSFSLLPDMPGALKAVLPLLKKGGQIYITQTYQRYTPPFLAYIKPWLRYMTTIDFGQLIPEDRAATFFQHQVPDQCHLECVEHEVIKGSVDTFLQAAYLTILRHSKTS
jgi:SAM-dependent methyltransferase